MTVAGREKRAERAAEVLGDAGIVVAKVDLVATILRIDGDFAARSARFEREAKAARNALRQHMTALRRVLATGVALHPDLKELQGEFLALVRERSEWLEMLEPTFGQRLQRTKDDKGQMRAEIVNRPPKPSADPAKVVAAETALDLLRENDLTPTTSAAGVFVRLASALYADPKGDLGHACRDVLAKEKDFRLWWCETGCKIVPV